MVTVFEFSISFSFGLFLNTIYNLLNEENSDMSLIVPNVRFC